MPVGGLVNFGVPTTPWSRAWLLHLNDGQALSNLGHSAYHQTLIPAANAAALKTLMRLDHVFDIRDYGATEGGIVSCDAAFTAAFAAACAVNGTVFVPDGSWLISTQLSIEITGNVRLAGTGLSRIIIGDGPSDNLVLRSDYSNAAMTLNANVSRGGMSLTVVSAAGVAVGDILEITTTLSNGVGNKQEVHRVKSIAGNVISLREPLLWSYATTDAGLAIASRTARRVAVEDIEFVESYASVQFQLRGLTSPTVRRCTFSGAESVAGTHLLLSYCTGARVEDVEVTGRDYGIEAASCRDALITGLRAYDCWSPVAPGYWSYNTVVDGYYGSNVRSALDCHSAVQTHYRHVDVCGGLLVGDVSLIGWQAMGGSLSDVRIYDTSPAGREGVVYLGNPRALTSDTDFYDSSDADIELRNVVWEHPNFAKDAGTYRFSFQMGRRISFSNCRMHYVIGQPTDATYKFEACDVQGGQFHRFQVNNGTDLSMHGTKQLSVIAGTADADDLGVGGYTSNITLSNMRIEGHMYALPIYGAAYVQLVNCVVKDAASMGFSDGYTPNVSLVNCIIDNVAAWGSDIDASRLRMIDCRLINGTPTPTNGDKLTLTRGLTCGLNTVLRGTVDCKSGAGGNTPGYVSLESPNGTVRYLFVEDDGTVKVHTAIPTANADGVVVGAQT